MNTILKFNTDQEKKEWIEKYVNPNIINKEYDLVLDEPLTNTYSFPLFTGEFCKDVIQLAEQSQKWVTDRHYYYPTTDMLINELGIDEMYNYVLNHYVMDIAKQTYNLTGDRWNKMNQENFIVKYTKEGQKHLGLHHDSSMLTLNLCLNSEFIGGGTYFPKYKKLLRLDKPGYAMIHPGNITHYHGARAIEGGKRYIIISFLRNR